MTNPYTPPHRDLVPVWILLSLVESDNDIMTIAGLRTGYLKGVRLSVIRDAVRNLKKSGRIKISKPSSDDPMQTQIVLDMKSKSNQKMMVTLSDLKSLMVDMHA